MNTAIPNHRSNSRLTTKPGRHFMKRPKALSEKSHLIAEPIWGTIRKIKPHPYQRKIPIITECILRSRVFILWVNWSMRMGSPSIILQNRLQTLRWSSQYRSKLTRQKITKGSNKKTIIIRQTMIRLKAQMTFHTQNQNTAKTQSIWNSLPKWVICKRWTTK